MKKLTLSLAMIAFLALGASAQDVKQDAKKAETKKEASMKKKGSCCADKKSCTPEEKKACSDKEKEGTKAPEKK